MFIITLNSVCRIRTQKISNIHRRITSHTCFPSVVCNLPFECTKFKFRFFIPSFLKSSLVELSNSFLTPSLLLDPFYGKKSEKVDIVWNVWYAYNTMKTLLSSIFDMWCIRFPVSDWNILIHTSSHFSFDSHFSSEINIYLFSMTHADDDSYYMCIYIIVPTRRCSTIKLSCFIGWNRERKVSFLLVTLLFFGHWNII